MENVNVNATVNNEEDPAKLIFNFSLAKFLLEEEGHPIIGLKMNRDNRDRTVFVFKDGLPLRDSMQKYNKLSRQRRAERAKTAKEGSASDEVDEGPQQED